MNLVKRTKDLGSLWLLLHKPKNKCNLIIKVPGQLFYMPKFIDSLGHFGMERSPYPLGFLLVIFKTTMVEIVQFWSFLKNRGSIGAKTLFFWKFNYTIWEYKKMSLSPLSLREYSYILENIWKWASVLYHWEKTATFWSRFGIWSLFTGRSHFFLNHPLKWHHFPKRLQVWSCFANILGENSSTFESCAKIVSHVVASVDCINSLLQVVLIFPVLQVPLTFLSGFLPIKVIKPHDEIESFT